MISIKMSNERDQPISIFKTIKKLKDKKENTLLRK